MTLQDVRYGRVEHFRLKIAFGMSKPDWKRRHSKTPRMLEEGLNKLRILSFSGSPRLAPKRFLANSYPAGPGHTVIDCNCWRPGEPGTKVTSQSL